MDKFACDVHAFDPTPRAVEYVRSKTADNPKYHFQEIGLWDHEGTLEFFAPENSNHVSHSLVNLQKTTDCIEVKVKRLSTLMDQHRHKKIDLLKLDIEGAEYKVLDSIIDDKIDIRILCVEFDEYFHQINKYYKSRIRYHVNCLLEYGFKLVHAANNGNYTFVKR